MRALFLVLLLLLAGLRAAAAQTELLVVSGLSGEPQYAQQFNQWGASLVDAARTRYGLRADQVVWLAEAPESDSKRITGKSTRDNVEKAIRDLAGHAGPADRVLVMLIGHGGTGGEPRLSLSGPDLTAADLAKFLAAFPTQSVVVVNSTSASGDFQDALAGRNRTVITATKSGLEGNETVFGGYFVDAFAGKDADADKDGRVSVLEAFDYAKGEVERHYKSENLLQSEHPTLGGSREAAAAFVLAPAASAAAAAAADTPELRALVAQREELEKSIEALKARKDGMDAAQYQKQLEDLLVQLALKTREIREKGGAQ
jgi:hypothetical protein